jgi:uncharacterized protein with GYD domain
MPVYITFSSLSDEGRNTLRKNPKSIKAYNKEIESMGVKVLAQYATLGEYDFVNIFLADNDEAIFKASMYLSGRGFSRVRTTAARHVDDFIALMEK